MKTSHPSAFTESPWTSLPLAGAGVAVLPEFGTLAELRRIFSIPRSTAYELERDGRIKFVRLRKRGALRGRVLVDLDSVRRYLAACAVENSRTEDAK